MHSSSILGVCSSVGMSRVFHDVAHFPHGYRFAYVAFSRILIQSSKVRLLFRKFSPFPPGEMTGYPCQGF